MDLESILKLIQSASAVVSHVTEVVNAVKGQLSESDADKVMDAANELHDSNVQLEQVVLAKLG
jgi:ribosomal protein L24